MCNSEEIEGFENVSNVSEHETYCHYMIFPYLITEYTLLVIIRHQYQYVL